MADQVAHLAPLNARDTTLVFASRAPQPDIERVKARMGRTMPWYTMTDEFDADFGVDEWHRRTSGGTGTTTTATPSRRSGGCPEPAEAPDAGARDKDDRDPAGPTARPASSKSGDTM